MSQDQYHLPVIITLLRRMMYELFVKEDQIAFSFLHVLYQLDACLESRTGNQSNIKWYKN